MRVVATRVVVIVIRVGLFVVSSVLALLVIECSPPLGLRIVVSCDHGIPGLPDDSASSVLMLSLLFPLQSEPSASSFLERVPRSWTLRSHQETTDRDA